MEIDKILTAKEQLHTKGYCSFQLKDFDENLYNYVYSKKPLEFESQKHLLTRVRIDIFNDAFQADDFFDTNTFVKDFETFEEAKHNIEYARTKYKKDEIFQVWYCGNSKPGNANELLFKGIFNKIVRYFYDIKPLVDLHFNSQYTMYDTGCFLQNHKDGQQAGRICVVLVYLNENYNKENGGLLILDNEYEIIPELGTIAILDLGKFDVDHEVTEIVGNQKRYCALAFTSYDSAIKQQRMEYEQIMKQKNNG